MVSILFSSLTFVNVLIPVEKSNSWSDVRTPSTESGTIYFLSNSGKFEKKYMEVRYNSIHLYSSERSAVEKKNSVAPILLTLCKIKLTEEQKTDEPIFSLVTATSTMTFKCLSQTEMTHWINFFKRVNKYNTHILRNQKREKERQNEDSSSFKESERIIRISSIEGNNICAECSSKDATWASINLGIFICLECSGIHRSLGVHISKVRSVELDIWTKEAVDFMESMGNIKANEEWEYLKEKALKVKPTESSSRVEKETFIHSKYIKKSFCKDSTGEKEENSIKQRKHAFTISSPRIFNEGWLKKKINDTWKTYWFVLEGNDLIYYKQRENPNYKGIIPLKNSQIGYSTEYESSFTFEIVTKERTHKLQAEDSSNFYVWTECIRALIDIFNIKAEKGGCVNESVNSNIIHQGWLYKEGGSVKSWKKRWFVLKKNKLSYYTDTDCKDLKGSIALSVATVKEAPKFESKSKKVPDERYSWFFEIVVSKRVYLISASSESERNKWIDAIKESKQEYIDLKNNSKKFVDYYKSMSVVK